MKEKLKLLAKRLHIPTWMQRVAKKPYHRAVDLLRARDFRREFERFQALAAQQGPRFSLNWEDRWPCLTDRTGAVDFDRHYIYHPAWAARVLAQTRPAQHVDISSTLAFVSVVSAFIPVTYYEFRPPRLVLDNLKCLAADLHALPFADGSLPSLSCMHVVEHVGLGRYGDPLDPDGDLRAIAELKRVVSPGGDLLFVVPVGKRKIQFNAHRNYAYDQVVEYFSGFQLKQFALAPLLARDGDLILDATREQADREDHGCGCFWFRKATN